MYRQFPAARPMPRPLARRKQPNVEEVSASPSKREAALSSCVKENVDVAPVDAHIISETSSVSADPEQGIEGSVTEVAREGATSEEDSHRTTPPIYSGYVRILDYGVKPRTGMTAKLLLVDPNDPLIHPFRGLRTAQHSGHRLRVVMSVPKQDEDDETLYVGDGSLSWWADDPKGMKATIRVDDGGVDAPERHPLTGYEAGVNDGDTIYLAVWALANDEQPEAPDQARKTARTPFRDMSETQQSHILCRDEKFQHFCMKQASKYVPDERMIELPVFEDSGSKFAAFVLTSYCGIESRADFKQDTFEAFQARQKWRHLMQDFFSWKRQDKRPPWDRGDWNPVYTDDDFR